MRCLRAAVSSCFYIAISLALLSHDATGATRDANNSNKEEIDTENMFGFTLGSDTEEAGEREIETETEGRFGKRDGSYTALSKKLELDYGLTDDFTISIGLLSSYHRIREVTEFEDTDRFAFNGIGTEFRWRLAKRGVSPFGITLHIEPTVQLHEEQSGQPATVYGSENRLIFDTELVKDRVFAAFNILYEFERSRERGSTVWESESMLGFSAAATGRFFPKAFIGAEIRYLRAYEGLSLQTFLGDALYTGPNLFWRVAENVSLSAAWNIQVAGREAGTDARLNLTSFERHQVRLKLVFSFEPERAHNARQYSRRLMR